MSRFSNKAYLQETAAQLQPELAFPIGRPEDWPRWRQALRARVAELLGGLSTPCGAGGQGARASPRRWLRA
jgi:hypothetical protein